MSIKTGRERRDKWKRRVGNYEDHLACVWNVLRSCDVGLFYTEGHVCAALAYYEDHREYKCFKVAIAASNKDFHYQFT